MKITSNKQRLFLFYNSIESLHPVHTKYIIADFSSGREIYNRIKYELNSIPVGILGKKFVMVQKCVQILPFLFNLKPPEDNHFYQNWSRFFFF